MKFRIIRDLPQGKIADVLPTQYRGLITHIEDESASCTIIVFRHDTRDIVHSREAAKALRHLGQVEGRILAVSGGFTVEALKLLRQRNIEDISRGYGWTDERHESIRIDIGARVKRPLIKKSNP